MGYSFSANYITSVLSSRNISWVYVNNITSMDRTINNVVWNDYYYPNSVNDSANTIYLNYSISFYETREELYSHAFVATFTFDSNDDAISTNSNNNASLSHGIIAVIVVCSFVIFVLIISFLWHKSNGTRWMQTRSDNLLDGKHSSSIDKV